MKLFAWQHYSQKMVHKMLSLRNAGLFTEREAKERSLRLVKGEAGLISDGNYIKFYWLVDEEDGVIVDMRYQAFAQSALLIAAEIVTDIIVGKNYDQARRVGADLIEKEAQGKKKGGFPKETYPHLNLIIDAIDDATEVCMDIPLSTSYAAPPAPMDMGQVQGEGYPGWDDLSLKQQLHVLEEVLDQDIRPYIALDAGGVEVINLVENRQVVITYQGSCTSCHSSTGATLSYIQQVLRARIHPDLVVTPEI